MSLLPAPQWLQVLGDASGNLAEKTRGCPPYVKCMDNGGVNRLLSNLYMFGE